MPLSAKMPVDSAAEREVRQQLVYGQHLQVSSEVTANLTRRVAAIVEE